MKKIASFLLKHPLYLGLGTFILNLFMSVTPVVLMYFKHEEQHKSIANISFQELHEFLDVQYSIVMYTLLYALIIAIIVSSIIILLAFFLKKSYEDIEKLSHFDALTGLFNRLMFMTMFEKEIAKINRSTHKLFLIILDIDDFKPINDNYGHLIGDEAIKLTARTLQSTLRAADTIARFGGDEFVISVVDKDPNVATGIINRILEQFNTTSLFITPQQDLQINLSIGYTAYKEGDDFKSMLHRADQALYISKEAGKNTATFLA